MRISQYTYQETNIHIKKQTYISKNKKNSKNSTFDTNKTTNKTTNKIKVLTLPCALSYPVVTKPAISGKHSLNCVRNLLGVCACMKSLLTDKDKKGAPILCHFCLFISCLVTGTHTNIPSPEKCITSQLNSRCRVFP